MSVEERLGLAHRALEEMWSDEAATDDRLHRFLARSGAPQHTGAAAEVLPASETAAHARTDAHASRDLPAHRQAATRTLCATGSRVPSAQNTHRTHTFGAGSGSAGPAEEPGVDTARRLAADSDSARMMDLVERAQAGEADAFGRLYDQYSDTVYRYIYYRVGGKATAEDLTSETFLRALRRIGTFTWQGRDFGAWLVTIARNLVADHFKSSRFRLEVTTGEMLDANEVERSPEDSVLESLSDTLLLDAVRRLSPQQQECATLRFLQGLSVAETARVMGKNEGAVRALQYRAVRGLARFLGDKRE
ncbi:MULTISPECIES: ECF subfamily RNA polymerase sigma factor, BldN family [unclassified Streptomyces]|jgi:RNA polymerase sigma-70 factor (ECF subfamily)|nr:MULTISPECIES: ECF subfamily RNA polymerase sigma factor, BldN family [unclassified Streptomyces]